MIQRFAGTVPTRSRAVAHDGLVYTVATAPQSILRATVYITDMAKKTEMNRAWDEWVDMKNVPQRACIGVALEGDDLVEILVIAAV